MSVSLTNYINTPAAVKALRDALQETLTFGHIQSGLRHHITDEAIDEALTRLVGKKSASPLSVNFANDTAAKVLGFNNIHEVNDRVGRMKTANVLPFDIKPGGRLPLKQVVYLTSSCCENAENVSQYYMEANNLDFSNTFEGDGYVFYPLSEDESSYIAEDNILVGAASDKLHVMTGYSVLIDNKKFIALAHEVHYEEGDEFLPPKPQALALHKEEALALQAMSENLGGFIAYSDDPEYDDEDEGLGHYLTLLCIPFSEVAQRVHDFEEWSVYLRLLDADGSDAASRKVIEKMRQGKTNADLWLNASNESINALKDNYLPTLLD